MVSQTTYDEKSDPINLNFEDLNPVPALQLGRGGYLRLTMS